MFSRLFGLTSGAAVSTLGVNFLLNDPVGLQNSGIVRFGRAAFYAVSIALDYKISLYFVEKESEKYYEEKSKVHWRSAIRLREMCCKNGGCFIKIGQHLGSLDYLLPYEYVKTMKVLHDNAPKSTFDEIRQTIREEFGKEIEEIFVEFDREPVGAASLAQVHRATLKDGRLIAVKVQHPKVKGHSRGDIATMEFLARSISLLFPDFQFNWLVEETKKNLPLELDFLHEARNADKIRSILKKFTYLKIPEIYYDLSTDRVLSMEFVEGGKIDDKQYMLRNKISVNQVSRYLGQMYSEMIFVHGFIHCDPHPGNVMVQKLPHGGIQIILLDHGLYQTLTDDFRIDYCQLWQSLIRADVPAIRHYAEKLGVGDMYGLFASILTARSWDSVQAGIDRKRYSQAEDDVIKTSASQYLPEITSILNRVPRQMLLILKTNDVLRGIETVLGTRFHASSFLTMSRCCTRAVARDARRKCQTIWCYLKYLFIEQVTLLRLSMYGWYLWLFA